ncbi:hypothetical protein [Halorubrum gandharaense]
MLSERHRRLHEYLKEEAGDSYRTAVHYDADDWDAIYGRPDLPPEELRDIVSTAVKRARAERALIPESEYPRLGRTHATTEVHENGVVIHLPEDGTKGTLISLDRSAASRLTEFVGTCSEIVHTPATERYAVAETVD